MGAQTGRRAGHRADLAELYRTRGPGRCALAGDRRVAAHLRGAAAGLALVEQGMEQAVARGRPRGLALVVTWLSEAYLLAGRLGGAYQRAAHAVDLARQHRQRGTQAWALWLLGESTARQESPEVES